MSVVTEQGALEAFAYLADTTFVDAQLKPFHWYKILVLEGAKYHGFPASYVAAIANVGSISDPERERAAANLEVLQTRLQ